MSIESLMSEIRKQRTEENLYVPPPADDETIEGLAREFQAVFGHDLPAEYKTILKTADGVMFNGLVFWPTRPHGEFQESLIDANRDFREMVDDRYLYFGKRDDVVFVIDTSTARFEAIDLSGMTVWKTFPDFGAMIEFALTRALM